MVTLFILYKILSLSLLHVFKHHAPLGHDKLDNVDNTKSL